MVDLTKPVAVMCFSGGAGGMERSAVRLARFLSSITTVVLVCKMDSFTENLYKEEGGHYSCESISFFSRVFSPAMMLRARAIINEYKIENVIFFGASELKTLHFSFIGKKLNLVVWHGTTKSKPKRDALHRLIYSNVNYHVALSTHLLNNVKKIVPEIAPEKYLVIRPSFDFYVGQRTKVVGTVLKIVHVGRIAKGKGQVDAVCACKFLKDNCIDFILYLIGAPDGSGYDEEVNAAIINNDLKLNVKLIGHVESVHDYLESADIFLFPSHGEGMPNALIEALHYQVICVAYNNTVFPEFAEMGFFLHLIQNGNIDILSKHLLQIAKNLTDENDKVKLNPELAKKYFHTERELNEWMDILV